jgi:hypothetical protein
VELVIVVVFDQCHLFAFGKRHHGEPARGRQGYGRGILMMRREVDSAQRRPPVQRGQRLDVDARLVDRHRHDASAGGSKRLPRRSIADALDRDDVARSHQRARNQRQRHLAPARHDDLAGADRQRPSGGKHRRQRSAQRWMTFRVAVSEE